ncbi:MAG: hypothetical protein LUI07_03955 [Lachnospiraceae bacterium]|nr:hypothetical protein [Lachnospiraceae bacterium]
MQRIEIYEETVQTGIGHSSKGNQLKWLQDGWWYKADAFGFESLAETVVSRLLRHSTIQDFVEYEPVMIRYKEKEYRGCRSRNFRGETEELIPLERLSRIYTGFGLARELSRIADVKQRILYTEELVRNVTGITEFGVYLAKMLEIDAFFLNEDRHTNNIAVLYDVREKEYRLCPFYDMGLSLFSDTRESYPLGMSFPECRERIAAKPFSRDFDDQMDAANGLYGSYLEFDFPATEVMDIFSLYPVNGNERETGYSADERKRVEEALRYQAGKYRYFFCGRT